MNLSALSSDNVLGKIARLPLALVPRDMVVPILQGRLRGKRWIAGSATHRCWLGFYEWEKQKMISREVRPNTVFHDVGANVGLYALLAAELVGAGRVFAFEPAPRNLAYLRKHLALNHVVNAEVLALALSDKNGSANFRVEPTGSMGHLALDEGITVPTATLDFLVEQGRILPPNYIKMDIEGAELMALKGASKSIQEYRPVIFLATHGREIHEACCELLRSWKYHLEDSGEDPCEELREVIAKPRRGSSPMQRASATLGREQVDIPTVRSVRPPGSTLVRNRIQQNREEKLNLGCGPNAPAHWLNVDGSWNAWFSNHRGLRKALETVRLIHPSHGAQWNVRPLVHNLKKPLPFRENTFSAVYASHVLEHLYLIDAQKLLSECRRVLKPRGVIRLVVPDLHFMVGDYLKRKNGNHTALSDKASAADHLNERLGFRSPAPPKGNFLHKFYGTWKDFHSHKWMYDSESLACYLELAGFQEVSEKEFLRSDIPGIEEVEVPGRVLGGAGICIEAKKS